MIERKHRGKPTQHKPTNQDQFLKPTVQTKLSMGKPGDKYEVEADQMADKVVNNPKTEGGAIQKKEGEEEVQQKPLASSITPLVQKRAASEEENAQAKLQRKEEEAVQAKGEEEEVQQKPLASQVTPLLQKQAASEDENAQAKLQRMEEEESVQSKGEEEEVQKKGEEEEGVQAKEEEEVQKKSNSNASQGSSVESRLRHGKGGQQMDKATKAEMESGFGADFSGVQIHTDSEAAEMSQGIGAQAFTHGNDIYFNKGRYDPNSKEGKHLLAHELTHTVQQTGMVQKYRDPSATNFGAADTSALKESSFNPETDRNAKPWIHKIHVTLSKSTVKDANDLDTHKGTLVAKYYDNEHKLSDISFSVTGGSTTFPSSEANHLVHRIEGIGYMSSAYSGDYTANPDNPRYNDNPNEANMHYAIFYRGGQAIHYGSSDHSSHGCLHAGDGAKLQQLNYHAVKGLTAVIVKYE